MWVVLSKNNVLKKVDIIKDREYILQKLKESEDELWYSFEESYKINLQKLKNLASTYENL